MDPGAPEGEWGIYRPGALARLVLFLSRHTLLGRGRGRVALGDLFLKLHPGPADVLLWGAPVRLHAADNRPEWKALVRPDRYDRRERDFLAGAHWDSDRGEDGAVFADIGANAGLYVLDILMRAPAARAVAIEPQPQMLARLRANLAFAGLGARTHIFAAAAGEADEILVLGGDGADAGSRALGLPGDDAAPRVRVRSLLDMLHEAGVSRIAAMKIDIEGWEDRALAPFLDQAPDSLLPQRIVIEHAHRSRWRRDCLAALAARGYRSLGEAGMNTLLELGSGP